MVASDAAPKAAVPHLLPGAGRIPSLSFARIGSGPNGSHRIRGWHVSYPVGPKGSDIELFIARVVRGIRREDEEPAVDGEGF